MIVTDEMLHDEPFMLSREEAAQRYGLSLREFTKLYRSNPEFPVLHVGRRVLIHRKGADDFFTRNIREVIEAN